MRRFSGVLGALAGLLLCLGVRAGRTADCNLNGQDDAADIASGASADCDRNAVPDECDLAPIHFGLRREPLTVARTPQVLAAADLDGDGRADIASAGKQSSGASTVSVILARGGGLFTDREDHAVAPKVEDLLAVDLDRDGDLDLAAVSSAALTLLQGRGEGSFAAPVEVPVENGMNSGASADLDLDGLPDLALTNRLTNQVSVLFGTEDGLFSAPTAYTAGDRPVSVAASDLDLDGLPDLAVANRESSAVSLHFNRSGGRFAPAVSLPVGSDRPEAVLPLDLELDGDPDLAVRSTLTVSLLAGDGAGNFSEPAVLPLRAAALRAGDLDGDGDTDLAAGSVLGGPEFHFQAVLNTGAGRLASAVAVSLPGLPQTLALGDLDADGDLDAVASAGLTQSITVLWNSEGLSLLSAVVGLEHRPHTQTMADANGDTFPDVLTGNGSDQTVTVFLNDRLGHLERTSTTRPVGYINSITTGDFDGDGDLDVALAVRDQNAVAVLPNDGGGTFGIARRFGVLGSQPFFVERADLDGDGRLDVIATNESSANVSLLFGAGDGTFDRRGNVPTGASRPVAAVADDLDGDGDVDLAVANHGSGLVTVHLNDGPGTFSERAVHRLVGRPIYITGGDLDLDGDVDLATANDSTRDISVLRNDSSGGFSEPVSFPVGRMPRSLIHGDINGDALLDLITADEREGMVSILLGGGGGTFLAGFHFRAGTDPRFVTAGDLEGDGDLDVVAANHTSRDLTVFHNQSSPAAQADYVEALCTEREFDGLAGPGAGAVLKSLKYVAPVRPGEVPIPTVYMNSRRYPLHQTFLAEVFPEHFPVLDAPRYDQIAGRRATRQYYVGAVVRARTARGPRFAFSVWTNIEASSDEVLTQEEATDLFHTLSRSFTAAPLAYFPDTEEARQAAAGWRDPEFEILLLEDRTAFAAYTRAVGYGTVRVLGREEFLEANAAGRMSFQDILVLPFAPRDFEGVVGGVITGEPQGPLSHIAVRTARRGTPNAFVRDALDVFRPLAGRLVRLEVSEAGYTVDPATAEEAQAFWESHRPRLGELPGLDPDHGELDSLEEMALEGGVRPEARYGGKATNLARLQRVLAGPFARYREVGFAVPMKYYLEFMRANTIPSGLDPKREVTYEDYLHELLADERFRSDPEYRFERLRLLREHGEVEGRVSAQLVTRVALRILEVFGSATHPVRFRSSSNVEDVLEFNGAGLYSSTSGCAADDLDTDLLGPSRCDRSRPEERGIARALKLVWLSLWNFRAYEEREFFGIPQDAAAMGVLVSRAFVDEQANGVAFTGNPADPGDPRYLVTAQAGEASVVSPEPGVLPEVDFLTVEGDQVTITRAGASTLVPAGGHVLSDEQLAELGFLLVHLDESFPVETGGHDPDDVALDLEFKVEANGELAIKQIRPFLNTVPEAPAPTFEIAVPAGLTTCGVFTTGRGGDPRAEYEAKSTIRFRAGTHVLPTAEESFDFELIDELLFGPDREAATAAAPGRFFVTRAPSAEGGGLTGYTFTYEQELRLGSGEPLVVTFNLQGYLARGAEAVVARITLDESFLTDMRREELDLLFEHSTLRASLPGRPDLVYASCEYRELPLFAVELELAGGDSVHLEERFLEARDIRATGPASLAGARVVVGGVGRRGSDYWSLVYSAGGHNTDVRYWVVLEPPLELPQGPVRAVEVLAPYPPAGRPDPVVNYLGEAFQVLVSPQVAAYRREEVVETGPVFLRGDADSDGSVVLADAVVVLNHLFRGGGVPPCETAADATDDGFLNLTDGVAILNHLFRGAGPLPEPFPRCGLDPSPDGLGCEAAEDCATR